MSIDYKLNVLKQKIGANSTTNVEWLKLLNITMDDVEYIMNISSMLKNQRANSIIAHDTSYQKACYCNGTMRDIANSYRNVHGYSSLFVCIFGTIANLINILVLTRRKMRNAPFAYILTWLAVTDMLLMTEYIPFVCYMYFGATSKSQLEKFSHHGAIYILIHTHISQVLHTISICLTLTLAFWRYNAVRYPEKSHTLWTKEKCETMVKIALLLPIIICGPSYIMFSVQSTIFYENGQQLQLYYLDLSELAKSNNELLYIINLWLYAVVIKLLPCVILIVISASLVQALNDTTTRKERFQESAITSTEGKLRIRKSKRKADRSSQMLIAILLLFLITEFPQSILGLLSGIFGRCFFKNCYHLFGEIMDILALLNGAINFILYCTMSKQFRQMFKEIFGKMIINRDIIMRSTNLKTFI